MKNTNKETYVAPTVEVVSFEIVEVLTGSTPDLLFNWFND